MEEYGLQLTPEGMDALEAGLDERFDEIDRILVWHVANMEQREENPPTEADLEAIKEWYGHQKLDESFVNLLAKGMVAIVGWEETVRPLIVITPRGAKTLLKQADEEGFEIPDGLADEYLMEEQLDGTE